MCIFWGSLSFWSETGTIPGTQDDVHAWYSLCNIDCTILERCLNKALRPNYGVYQ